MITRLDRLQGRDIYENTALAKINELVDAVNVLQCKNVHIESDLQDLMYPKEIKGELGENVQDKFAEQRKWIGKLCRFRDEHVAPYCWDYGILEDIEDGYSAIVSNFRSSDGYWYDICELVKPDDDIIYKGEM